MKLKHKIITNGDIKRGLSDEQKHYLALKSCIDKVDVDVMLEPISKIMTTAYNISVDLVNSLPKEYWEARMKLEGHR